MVFFLCKAESRNFRFTAAYLFFLLGQARVFCKYLVFEKFEKCKAQ